MGKSQVWMLVVFASILLATIFSRFYCGWMCPINTVITPIQKLKNKFKIGNKTVNKLFRSEIPRYLFFAIFLVGLVIKMRVIKQGGSFPLPVIIITIGAVITLLFNVETWHRYLCPWGVLLSLSSKFSKFRINKDDSCISCKKCVKTCPGLAIDEEIKFEKNHCLLCFECVEGCPVDAIHYKK